MVGGGGGAGDRKICDSCKSSPANSFCSADAAFLCSTCDARVHAANKLASRHARVGLCDVCEHAPAAVTCKADAAALCVTCDRDIHSANPLARRHERVPVMPFYESADKSSIVVEDSGFFDEHPETEEEEAEAASWLLPNPNLNKIADDLDFDHDDDYHSTYPIGPYFVKDVKVDTDNNDKHQISHFQFSCGNDGVVPVHVTNNNNNVVHQQHGSVVDGFPAYDVEYSGSKPFMYNFNSQSISQSVSSSSLDVGVVPDHNALAEVSNCLGQNSAPAQVPDNAPLTGMDREARVMRYREKRKNRKFEKTIRYASRKAYAETRPRIKGRFAKRSEMDVGDLLACDTGYGVVPSF